MKSKKVITQFSYDIVSCAIKVHKELGPGLLESVYEKCLKHELHLSGFEVEQQISIPIYYKGLSLETELRLDLLVNDLIVVEIKAAESIHPVFEAQILTYMKLLQKPQGLLINFFTTNITKSLKPFVNEYYSQLPD